MVDAVGLSLNGGYRGLRRLQPNPSLVFQGQ